MTTMATDRPILLRCADAFLNGVPMRVDGTPIEGYVTVHITEEFRDEVIRAATSTPAHTKEPHGCRPTPR